MNFAVFSVSFIERAGMIFLLNILFPKETLIEAYNVEMLQNILEKNRIKVLVVFDNASNKHPVNEIISILKLKPEIHCLLVLGEFEPEKHKILLETQQKVSFLLKHSDEEEFKAALKSTVSGNRYICSQVSNLLLKNREIKNENRDKNKLLTNTETEILKQITLGKTTKEIASIRNVSIHTVMTHRKNIFRKIEVNTVHDATKYAMRAGIVELAEYYI